VIHYPRNGSIKLPFSAALFDNAGSPITGQASTTTCTIYCPMNGYRLDSTDNTFKTNPTAPNHTTTAETSSFANIYKHTFDVTNWPRGIYLAHIAATTDGVTRYYQQDFSVGLFVERKLGYSAVYSGSQIVLSLWVDEGGVAQADYVSLNNCRLLDADGEPFAEFGDRATPTNGVFTVIQAVELAVGFNFICDCVATCHGPAGTADYQFPLRVGLARP